MLEKVLDLKVLAMIPPKMIFILVMRLVIPCSYLFKLWFRFELAPGTVEVGELNKWREEYLRNSFQSINQDSINKVLKRGSYKIYFYS